MSKPLRPVKFCRHCNTQIIYRRATHRWVHAATSRAECRAGDASEAEPKEEP